MMAGCPIAALARERFRLAPHWNGEVSAALQERGDLAVALQGLRRVVHVRSGVWLRLRGRSPCLTLTESMDDFRRTLYRGHW
jgi:uncharacterized protein YbjT (DUF2867 family)